MIELTPLDVRKKRGDFARALRGYDPEEVDVFLELVAERVEGLVRENLQLRERAERLGEQVDAQGEREQAVQEALVTAQELRRQVKEQAKREAELLEREARGRIERMLQDTGKLFHERRAALEELERRRSRFLRAFRALLERELDVVELESNHPPLDDLTLHLELGRRSRTAAGDEEQGEGLDVASDPEGGGDGEADEEPPEPDGPDSDGERNTDADADADLTAGLETDEAERGEKEEEAPESDDEDSLWLSSILKRDQPEKE